jgi:hypothetical protein
MPRTSRVLSLIERLGLIDEEVAGDLVEELHGDRPRDWIWFQAFHAVITTTSRTVRANPLLAGGGIAFAWAVALSWEYSLHALLTFATTMFPMSPVGLFMGLAVVNVGIDFLLGAVLGRACRPHGPAVAVAVLMTFTVAIAAVISMTTIQMDGMWWIKAGRGAWTASLFALFGAAMIAGAAATSRRYAA